MLFQTKFANTFQMTAKTTKASYNKRKNDPKGMGPAAGIPG